MPIVESVVAQHAEDAAFLWTQRDHMIGAPRTALRGLLDCDRRVEAHIDGLRIAGEAGWPFCEAGLQSAESGEVFAAAVIALESANAAWFQRVCATVAAVPEAARGLRSALGWTAPERLPGKVAALLVAPDPFWRAIGITGCAAHRVDGRSHLSRAIEDPDPGLRSRALRAAGETGRCDLRDACVWQCADPDPQVRYRAASAALLLGEREQSLAILADLAAQPGPWRAPALELCVMALEPVAGARLLRAISRDPAARRLVIAGAGVCGDVAHVPWLISLLGDDVLARPAGGALATMIGHDLADLGLDRAPAASWAQGPGDDPAGDDLEPDPDDGLSWPDQARVQAWWDASRTRFPPGARYFMGEPLTSQQCQRVLRAGPQGARQAAATYLCLAAPCTPLFPIAAPAWRQWHALGGD